MKRQYKDKLVNFTFLIPALLFFSLVVLIPFFRGLNIAFTNWDGISPTYDYVGLHNLKLLFSDEDAIEPIKNTLFFAFVTTFFVNVIGLLLAVALNTKFKGVNLLKTFIFMPMVISLVLAAIIWRYIYSDIYPILFHTDGGLLAIPRRSCWGSRLSPFGKKSGWLWSSTMQDCRRFQKICTNRPISTVPASFSNSAKSRFRC